MNGLELQYRVNVANFSVWFLEFTDVDLDSHSEEENLPESFERYQGK